MEKYVPSIEPFEIDSQNRIRLVDIDANNWAFQRLSKKFKVWDTVAYVGKTENLTNIAKRFASESAVCAAQGVLEGLPRKPTKRTGRS